jgi:hypothetical protein
LAARPHVPNASIDVSSWDRYKTPSFGIKDNDDEFSHRNYPQKQKTLKKNKEEKNMKNYKTIIGVAVVGLALAAVSTQAQLVLTGGHIAGQLVNQELTGVSPGGNAGVDNGLVSSWVISGAAADPTGLIFVYQIVNSGPGAVDNAEFNGFIDPPSVTDVISSAPFASLVGLSFGSTPTAAGWATPGTLIGGVTFENGNMPNGGAISDYLAVLTTDRTFTGNYGQIQDGFSAQGPILAPSAVPEANTVVAGALMLLPLGIGAVRALRKERIA